MQDHAWECREMYSETALVTGAMVVMLAGWRCEKRAEVVDGSGG